MLLWIFLWIQYFGHRRLPKIKCFCSLYGHRKRYVEIFIKAKFIDFTFPTIIALRPSLNFERQKSFITITLLTDIWEVWHKDKISRKPHSINSFWEHVCLLQSKLYAKYYDDLNWTLEDMALAYFNIFSFYDVNCKYHILECSIQIVTKFCIKFGLK